jgi:hypothetical protein
VTGRERQPAECVSDGQTVADLIEHLESHLGRISGGTRGDRTTPADVQIVYFAAGTPFPGTTSLMTLGLSRHHLHGPGGIGIHQELLMHVPTVGDYAPRAAGILFQVAGEMIGRGQGLKRGQLIGPRGALFRHLASTALVVADPSQLPDSFATWQADGRYIHVVWLVPITTGEAHVVQQHGWLALKNAFIEQDADLVDPARAEITLDAVAG